MTILELLKTGDAILHYGPRRLYMENGEFVVIEREFRKHKPKELYRGTDEEKAASIIWLR